MPNREKVINGLEWILNDIKENGHYQVDNYEDEIREALVLLKEQEAVKPRYIDGKRNHFIVCGNCNINLIRGMKYCSYCGKAVKWNE